MQSITNLLPSTTRVIRDGKVVEMDPKRLVIGDVVQIENGDRVPADLRIITIDDTLSVNNSFLTGESEAVSCTIESTDLNFMESHNLLFMSAMIVQGGGKAVVINTGKNAVMGNIAKLTRRTRSVPSTLRKSTRKFVIAVVIVALILIILVVLFWVLYLRREREDYLSVAELVSYCVALLIALIPEGLPVALTLTLTILAKRMYNQRVLVKSLPIVETLGAIDVICSDKVSVFDLQKFLKESQTGTLTQGVMNVNHLVLASQNLGVKEFHSWFERSHPLSIEFLQIASLCNRAHFDAKQEIIGDAADTALVRFSNEFIDVEEMRSRFEKILEIPFNSKNKWMLCICLEKESNRAIIMMKGAAEVILGKCTTVLNMSGEEEELTQEKRSQFMLHQQNLSHQGGRVLGMCRLVLDLSKFPINFHFDARQENFPKEGMCLIGLFSLADPPRQDTKEAVFKCKQAGIRVVMVTGDFSGTAVAIAKQTGIIMENTRVEFFSPSSIVIPLENDPSRRRLRSNMKRKVEYVSPEAQVVNGTDISKFGESHWDYVISHEQVVFARTTPEHKLQIVKQYQRRGHIVAVTGDGVNDAPALKQADAVRF